MNTKVDYLYRDANNYKMWNQCIVKGDLSVEQKQEILDSLHEGEFFIPRKVGLPEGRFDKWDSADHIWFEINEDSFTSTEQEPTVSLSIDELVNSFAANKGKWEDDISLSIEEAKASVDKHQWTITDPDCLQIRRLAGYGNQNIFELVQIDIYDLYDKTIYKIAHGDINLSEYTDKEKDIFLKMYGYSDMNELIDIVGSELEAKGQIAEMIFETYNTDYHVEEHTHWNEAVSRIEEYTELDLNEYKQQLKMEDFDYLSSFVYKEDELSSDEERFILGMISSDGTVFYISEKYGDLIRGSSMTVDSTVNISGQPDYFIIGGYAENGLFFIYDESGNILKEEVSSLIDENPVYISEKMKEKLVQIGLKGNIQKVTLNERLKFVEKEQAVFNKRVNKSKHTDLSL